MADNMNNNIAILSLMAKLEDNSKEISAQAKKMIGKVEKNAGTVEFGADTKEVQNAIEKINKLIEGKLKGIDLTKQFGSILKVFSNAESSAEDYLNILNKVHNELFSISKLPKNNLDLMGNFSPKQVDQVLKVYDKLLNKQEQFQKKQEEARKKAQATEADSLISLKRRYNNTDTYKKYSTDEAVSSLSNQIGLENNTSAKRDIKQYSQLLAIYDLLQNKKKELANINTAEAAYEEVQINKNLLSIINEITTKEKRLASSFGAKDLLSSSLEGFDTGEVNRNILRSIDEYSTRASAVVKDAIKKLQNELDQTILDYSQKNVDKMVSAQEKASEKVKTRIDKRTSSMSSSQKGTQEESVGSIGDSAKEATSNVQKLDTALDNLGDNSDSGLDLWVESAKNLKEEFSDVVKYAVDAETALEKIVSLNKALNNRVLSEDEEKDLVGFSQRYLALGKDLSEDQEDTFYDYADDYKNMIVQIQSMTEKQLSEIEKLKVAQKEVTEQPISESSATFSMEKQIEETTEAVEKLAQAEKEVIEQTQKLEQEFSGDGFVDKEELDKVNALLKEFKDNSKVKVDIDITEAVGNTEIVRNKLDEIPNKKEIEIRVKDYSDIPYLTDPKSGKPTTLYRGTRDAMSGTVGADQNGLSYYSTDKRVAESYIAKHGGKIITANGAMKNPLEIDVEGSHWDQLTYIGEGFDEVSNKLWNLKDSINEYLDALNNLKKDSAEYKEICDKLNSAFDEQKRILADTSNPYVMDATTDEFADKVKASGLYDGLILKNIVDGGGITATDVVFFDEQQIRNAQVLNSELSETIQKKEEIATVDKTQEVSSTQAQIESQQKLQTELEQTEQQAKETATALSDVDQSSVLSVNQTEVLSNQTPLSLVEEPSGQLAMFEGVEEQQKKVEESVKETNNAIEGQIDLFDYLNEQASKTKQPKLIQESSGQIAMFDGLEESQKEVQVAVEQTNDTIKGQISIDEYLKNQIKETADAYDELIGKLKKYNALKEKQYKGNLGNDKLELDKLEAEINDAVIGQGKYANATDEAAEAQKRFNRELKEYQDNFSSRITNKLGSTLNSYASKGNKTSAYYNEIKNIKAEIDKLDIPIDFTDENSINGLKESEKYIRNMMDSLKDKKYDLVSDDEVNTLLKQASRTYFKNTAAPKELRDSVKSVVDELERLKREGKEIDRITFDKVKSSLKDFEAQIERTGKTGVSMGDKIKKKFGDVFAYFATYVSIQDFIQMFRQGFETIKKYDNALTEMNKVSEESIQTLKGFQKESFDLADSIGTTASQIQNSTADWMRLGESLEEAKQSAQDANILFNVSEFETIDEATDSLVSMSQAFKDLEKGEIIDVVNNLGNNFAISTDGLATALKDSASSLQTAQNDFFESAALVTAANTVVQDPAKVGAGLRTIALRLTGTEAAREELASLGEDVDDFVVTTTSKMDQQIKDLTKTQGNFGVSLLDMNGNYRSTYEVLLDIAKVWDKIAEEDLVTGENRQNALLEMMAGKNRSNILASVLQSPEVLEEAYAYALDSEGSAMRENEAYLESIEAHLAQLKNAWDSLWVNENNREVITFFLDLAKGILEVVDDIGVLNTALLTIGAGFGIKKSLDGGGRAKCCPSSEYATGEFSSDVYELCIA